MGVDNRLTHVARAMQSRVARAYHANGVIDMLNYDHEYDESGNHRLIIGGTVGDWAGYAFIAHLEHDGNRYAATTEYYGSTLPRVFILTESKFNEIAP